MRNYIMPLLMLAMLMQLGCSDDVEMTSSCDGFPLAYAGTRATYRKTYEDGQTYTFSVVTEAVDRQIAGYDVVLKRSADSPPDTGSYYTCDPELGLFRVAYTSYSLDSPENIMIHIEEPPATPYLKYGDPVGKTWVQTDEEPGSDITVRHMAEVISYEDVTVPYRTFSEAMKVEGATYYNDELDDDGPPWFSWRYRFEPSGHTIEVKNEFRHYREKERIVSVTELVDFSAPWLP